MKYTVEQLTEKAYGYRKRFLELFTNLGFGHVTSAFSWTEIATVLYNEIMNVAPNSDTAIGYDKMVVSKGHGAGMLFPIFEELGYFSNIELGEVIKIGGSSEKLRKLFYPAFDFYGGSLGIGIGIAAGLAKAAKLSEDTCNVFCLVGDAECYEGSVWEAINFAAHNRLDNLIVVVDRNRLGCSDFTEHMLAIEPFADKWQSFNWLVEEIDGHDLGKIYDSLNRGKNNASGKPYCVIANTKKGQGLNYLIDKPLMHGYMPKGEDIKRAFEELR